MKTFIPIGSALVSTLLTVYGCHMFGMRGTDLGIAATVAGVVSLTVSLSALWLAGRRVQKV
ncbi:MAG: hypothetical protein V4773_23285 [Verrucomicrobiota bacterium]